MYTIGNCCSLCQDCNSLKLWLSPSEFLGIVALWNANLQRIINYCPEIESMEDLNRLASTPPDGTLGPIPHSLSDRRKGMRKIVDEPQLQQMVHDLLLRPCTYCKRPFPYGIDRLDSNLSYAKLALMGKLVSCCGQCNVMMLNRPLHKVVVHVKRIFNHMAGIDPTALGVRDRYLYDYFTCLSGLKNALTWGHSEQTPVSFKIKDTLIMASTKSVFDKFRLAEGLVEGGLELTFVEIAVYLDWLTRRIGLDRQDEVRRLMGISRSVSQSIVLNDEMQTRLREIENELESAQLELDDENEEVVDLPLINNNNSWKTNGWQEWHQRKDDNDDELSRDDGGVVLLETLPESSDEDDSLTAVAPPRNSVRVATRSVATRYRALTKSVANRKFGRVFKRALEDALDNASSPSVREVVDVISDMPYIVEMREDIGGLYFGREKQGYSLYTMTLKYWFGRDGCQNPSHEKVRLSIQTSNIGGHKYQKAIRVILDVWQKHPLFRRMDWWEVELNLLSVFGIDLDMKYLVRKATKDLNDVKSHVDAIKRIDAIGEITRSVGSVRFERSAVSGYSFSLGVKHWQSRKGCKNPNGESLFVAIGLEADEAERKRLQKALRAILDYWIQHPNFKYMKWSQVLINLKNIFTTV